LSAGTPEKRLHEGIGYVTPDDKHQGRSLTIRKARRDGPKRARVERINYHRKHRRRRPHNVG
jgi:putative transposase